MKCVQCGNSLSGKQKMYCSNKCKDKKNNKKRDRTENQKRCKEYREKNKESISANKKRYYVKHRERLLKIRKQYAKDNPETDKRYKQSAKGRLMIYKRGAKKRNLEFKLTLEDFKNNWNKQCEYCGDDINGIGLDRVDNNIGYIGTNIVLCCETCNRMKLQHSKKDFINKCKQIAKFNN